MPTSKFRVVPSKKRKRIALRIAADGIVEILHPAGMTHHVLQQIFDSNQQIISALLQRFEKKKIPEFTEGTYFMFLGEPYPLHITCRLRIFDNKFMIPQGSDSEMRNSIITLYRELAASVINQRMTFWIKAAGVTPEKIRISSANTRWGSCSGRKTLSFSWQLVQCPIELIDYVIVHELCHIKELNHSQHFWDHVRRIIPDYAERKRQLRIFAAKLPRWY